MSKQYDNLEKYFRSQFNKRVGEEDWNTPDEDVLDRAFDVLDKNPVRKNSWRRLLPFLLLLLPIIGGLGVIYFYQSSLSKSQNQIENLESDNDQLVKENENLKKEIQNLLKGSVAKNTNELQGDDSLFNRERNEDIGTTPEHYKSIVQNAYFGEITDDRDDLPVIGLNGKFIGENEGEALSDNRTHYTIASISSVKPRTIDKAFDNNKLTYQNSIIQRSNDQQIEATKNWILGIGVTGLLSTVEMRPDQPDGALKNYNHWYNGQGFEVMTQYSFNRRWSAGLRIAYARTLNESDFNQEMFYDENNAYINGQGEKVYLTSVDIQTPTGSQNAFIEFAVEPGSQDGDKMDQATHSVQKFDFVGLNPFVSYKFITKGEWTLMTELGVQYNHVWNQMNEFEMSMSMDEKVMDKRSVMTDKKSDLLSSNISARVGLVVSRQLNSRLSGVMGINYVHGLTPISEQNLGVKSKTFQHSVLGSVGLNLIL